MELKLCFKFNSRLFNYLFVMQYSNYSKYVNRAKSGKINFENDFHNNHIETSTFQKLLLGLGSGFMSIADPRRGDMVAVMGESTGAQALKYIQSKMQESEEGRQILKEKPRISSSVVDLEKLKEMPEGTLGKAYSNFLERYKYSPDERLAVRFVDDLELAYVAQRYREAHDLFHTILDMPTNMLGEVTVKWVEAIQTKLPMCITGALFGPLRLAPKSTRAYSTTTAVIMDPDVSAKLKEDKNLKHHPGKVKIKRVFVPEHLENAIISVVKENQMLYLFGEALKKKESWYKKLIPKEGLDRENLVKNFKTNMEVSLNNKKYTEDELKLVLNSKLKRYENYLDAISTPTVFDLKNSVMYLLARFPYEYASLINIFTEISLKDRGFKPKTIFDFGSGVGTVIWAASEVWRSGITEYFTVDTSTEMNNLASSIVNLNQKKLPVKNFLQRQFLPAEEVEFDIVVCAFSLSHLCNYEDRKTKINVLWKKVINYLVIVENGTSDGFQIINEARDIILRKIDGPSFKSHVVAPCPHDFVCPKTQTSGKKTCFFLAKYRELKTSKEETYDETPYSFVVFKKGSRRPDSKQWPRILSEPISKAKQVTCKMCTSEGKLKEVVFTKAKHGAELFGVARRCVWGDCLPAKITENVVEEQREQRMKYVTSYLPWAIETGMNSDFLMNIYFEKRWDQTLSSLYQEYNIKPLLKK